VEARFLDVLELNLFAQDLIVAAPPELAEPLLQRTRDRGGVAHLLFHPAHVAKPGVAEAMGRTISQAKELGMEWWTSDRVGRWERARRGTRLARRNGRLSAGGEQPLPGGTLLLLDVTGKALEGQAAGWERVQRWGFPFWRRVADLPAELPLPGVS
jgi:hypothetical protein